MNTVLFDLDGTLLPMDQDEFVQAYFKELAGKGGALGYDPQKMVQAVLDGFEAMVRNDGTVTNEKLFWEIFKEAFGADVHSHVSDFERFYANEFRRVKNVVHPTPLAEQYISILRGKGYRIILATNPVFPRVATLERIRWAGMDPHDFDLITTYEDFHFAKPNLAYYQEIVDMIGKEPQDCIMIGNDVQEDMCAARLGMDTFLVTDDLINTTGEDISSYTHGDRQVLLDFIKDLPVVEDLSELTQEA
jgi:HAD superfamily hydrolase (TIGR01549 family)